MLIKLTHDKSCTDGIECSNNIIKKLKEKYSDLILESKTKEDKVNGHLSISHTNKNHEIWIFAYSEKGIAESENTITKKIDKQNNPKVIKYTGTSLKESEIKKII
tara:strand:- start:67 stop:381 length:315 start_codon:yes stop_codon:yes gene_type:complete